MAVDTSKIYHTSKYNYHKIFKAGDVTAVDPTVAHNLGGIPFVRVWFEPFAGEITEPFMQSVQSRYHSHYDTSPWPQGIYSVDTANLYLDSMTADSRKWWYRIYELEDASNKIYFNAPAHSVDKILLTLTGMVSLSGALFEEFSFSNPLGELALPIGSISQDNVNFWYPLLDRAPAFVQISVTASQVTLYVVNADMTAIPLYYKVSLLGIETV